MEDLHGMSDKQLALETQEPMTAIATTSPLSLVQQAIERGMDGAQLNSLMDFAERYQRNESKAAYSVAFAAFKKDAVRIVRNTTVSDGPLKGKKYADLFGVVDAVTPALSEHGLSHSWKLTKDEPGWMEVTCTLSHVGGHSESVSMGSGPDTGPGRNAIQARASAKNYLERYTLLAITGLAPAGADDDGRKAGGATMPEQQYVEQLDFIQAASSQDELKRVFTVAYGLAKAAGDKDAMAAFIKAKDNRKSELPK